MTGGENKAQREAGLAFTSPAPPPPPAPVRRPSGVNINTTDDFVIEHLHKLELAGGPGGANRLADSAHLQVENSQVSGLIIIIIIISSVISRHLK